MSAHLNFEPKEAGQAVPGPGSFRLGFSWSAFFYPGGSLLASRRGIDLSAQSQFILGSRKPSVPGRVHSVLKSYGSQAAAKRQRSNPWLTHGTVESPAKRLLAVAKEQRAAASNQSQGLESPTPFLAGDSSQKSVRVHGSKFKSFSESRRAQSDPWAPSPTLATGSRRLSQIHCLVASSGNIRAGS